jgi:5-methylcytosine-specific restriction endonuclease McrA
MILKGIHLSSGKTNPFYLSKAWRDDRKHHLACYPYCVFCGKKSTVSDHINPINQGGAIWDWANRQALCKSCHGKKNNSDKEYYGRARY